MSYGSWKSADLYTKYPQPAGLALPFAKVASSNPLFYGNHQTATSIVAMGRIRGMQVLGKLAYAMQPAVHGTSAYSAGSTFPQPKEPEGGATSKYKPNWWRDSRQRMFVTGLTESRGQADIGGDGVPVAKQNSSTNAAPLPNLGTASGGTVNPIAAKSHMGRGSAFGISTK